MSRSRILSPIAAASFGMLLLGACSADALTERAANFGLERALEGNQDVDFDFGGDGNGGFRISTDEGDFALNFDQENGGINFNTSEGDGRISFGENGIVFNTDEGDGVISFDQENGSINFNTSEGDGAINFDDNGGITVQTDEGDLGLFSSTVAPDSWPAGIGVPASLVPGSANFSVLDLGAQGAVTTGVFNHSPDEPYAASVVDNLVDAGWQVTTSTTQNGTFFAQLGNGSGGTAQVIGDANGSTTVSLTQTPG